MFKQISSFIAVIVFSFASFGSYSDVETIREVTENHPVLANSSCLNAAMISVQAFKDCMFMDVMAQDNLTTDEKNEALAHAYCSMVYDPQAFRDCALGQFIILSNAQEVKEPSTQL